MSMNFPYQTGANASGIRNQDLSFEPTRRRSISSRHWPSDTKTKELVPDAKIARPFRLLRPRGNGVEPHRDPLRRGSCIGELDLERSLPEREPLCYPTHPLPRLALVLPQTQVQAEVLSSFDSRLARLPLPSRTISASVRRRAV